MMLVLPAQGVSSWALREQLRHTFAQRLHFSPEDQEAVFLPDFGSGVAVITAILRGIQAFLAASGMMTMAVGILGVANMMFFSGDRAYARNRSTFSHWCYTATNSTAVFIRRIAAGGHRGVSRLTAGLLWRVAA